MNIINAKDIKHDHITALIYGTPGMGKTSLLGLLPGRTLIVDIDKGTSVLAGCENVDIVRLDRFQELDELARQFAHDCPYNNVCIDTLSELENGMLNGYAKQSNTGLPQIQDYGKVNNHLLYFCRTFRNLDANVFFTAWEQYTEIASPSGDKYSRIEPMIRAKNLENICGLCDIIGRLYHDKDTNSRRVWLDGRINIIARDRIFKRQSCDFQEVIPNGCSQLH